MKKPPQHFAFEIVAADGTRKLRLIAPRFWQHYLNTKTKVGDKGVITLSLKKASRSQAQLNYYWSILAEIAEHTGYTAEELHDALMVLKWGTKKVRIGKQTVAIRRSIANDAQFPKFDMVEQIDFAIKTAEDLNVTILSPEEAGYTSNHRTDYEGMRRSKK